jgi:hypothetical protein
LPDLLELIFDIGFSNSDIGDAYGVSDSLKAAPEEELLLCIDIAVVEALIGEKFQEP